jgi:hypothetical protein
VLETVLDVRVVDDTAAEAGGESGESAGGVSEEELEVGVAVEDTGEDEAGDGLFSGTR